MTLNALSSNDYKTTITNSHGFLKHQNEDTPKAVSRISVSVAKTAAVDNDGNNVRDVTN